MRSRLREAPLRSKGGKGRMAADARCGSPSHCVFRRSLEEVAAGLRTESPSGSQQSCFKALQGHRKLRAQRMRRHQRGLAKQMLPGEACGAPANLGSTKGVAELKLQLKYTTTQKRNYKHNKDIVNS